MSHTKEPWHVHHDIDAGEWPMVMAGGVVAGVIVANVNPISFSCVTGGNVEMPSAANAARIVACVNACAGLSTDDLMNAGLVSAVGYQLIEKDAEIEQQQARIAELERLLDGESERAKEREIEYHALRRERDDLSTKAAALQLEAEAHAQEARTANATIAEIYQLVTGATGEPGNWNGAEPVRKKLADLERVAAIGRRAVDVDRLRKLLAEVGKVAMTREVAPEPAPANRLLPEGWSVSEEGGGVIITIPDGGTMWIAGDVAPSDSRVQWGAPEPATVAVDAGALTELLHWADQLEAGRSNGLRIGQSVATFRMVAAARRLLAGGGK